MKKRIYLAAAIMWAATGLAADPVSGLWQTQVDDGRYAYVDMKPCGDKICGSIAKAFDSNGPYEGENIGKLLVWDMAPGGNGSYSNGKIWQPSTGKIYRSKMKLNGNKLNVSGCVGPICKKQVWARVQ